MRFKPQVIHPDPPPTDERGELELPTDLALLAEQLQMEAEYLACMYPPDPFYDVTCSANVRPAERRRRRANWLRRSARLGILASVVVLVVAAPIVLKHARPPMATTAGSSTSDTSDAISAKQATATGAQTGTTVEANPGQGSLLVGPVSADQAYVLSLPFRHNSSPRLSASTISKLGHQREAELDLLELEPTRITIFVEL